jgi:hypothetical protein
MSRPKGLPKTGGRKRGTKNRRTSRIVVEAAREGITPLEVQLRTMRMLWERAHRSSEPDLQLAKEACAVAAQCAPYCHPRLANVEARIDAVGRVEIDIDVISQEERLLDQAFGQLRVLQHPKVIEAAEITRPGSGDDGEDRAVDGS